MTPEEWGITIGLVMGITFVFDVVELQPRVGWKFLRSLNYLFHHAFRVLLGVLASHIIFESNLEVPLPLTAFIAVFASVTTIQNFAVNVGGSEVARLSGLLDTFRDKMLTEEEQRNVRRAEKHARTEAAEELRIRRRLAELYPSSELEGEKQMMLLQAGWTADHVTTHIQGLKRVAAMDERFLKNLMASEIVEMNPEYARALVAEREQQNRGR